MKPKQVFRRKAPRWLADKLYHRWYWISLYRTWPQTFQDFALKSFICNRLRIQLANHESEHMVSDFATARGLNGYFE